MKILHKKKILQIMIGIMVFMTITLISPATVKAEEKYMKGESTDFSIVLDENGDAHIKEVWNCYFGGDTITRYSRNFKLPDDAYTIQMNSIQMDGEEMQFLDEPDDDRPEGCVAIYEKDNRLNLDMYLSALNESHEFIFDYLVKDAVILHEDIAEFQWVLISDKEAFDIENITGKIIMPADTEEGSIHFWGHGPEENTSFGPVSEEGKVKEFAFNVPSAPKGRLVSVRFAMPLELFPSGSRHQSGNIMEKIMEEEKQEGKFSFYESVLSVRQDKYTIFSCILIALPLFLAKPLGLLFGKYGKGPYTDKKLINLRCKPQNDPQYSFVLPSDMKPAMVYKLTSVYPKDGKIVRKKGNVPAAILADLMNRGVIEYHQEGKEIYLNNTQDEALMDYEHMPDYEKAMVEMVAGAGKCKPVTLKQINKYLKKYYKISEKLNKRINEGVDKEFDALGLVEEVPEETKGIKLYIVGIFIFIACVLVGMKLDVGLLVSGGMAFAIVCSMAFMVSEIKSNFHPQIKYLTQEGENEHAAWQACARFFENISAASETESYKPAEWRNYLPYAIAMGRNEKMEKQLKIKFPKVYETIEAEPYLYIYYHMTPYWMELDKCMGYQTYMSQIESKNSESGGFFSGGGGDYSSGSGGSSFD